MNRLILLVLAAFTPFLALALLGHEDAPVPPAQPAATRAPAASLPRPHHSVHRVPRRYSAPSLAYPEIPKLAELRECYERTCAFAQGDPREYDQVVGQALKAVLLSLAERARAKGLHDPRIAEAARTQLEIEDKHVQSAALAVLATQAPETATRDEILRHVIDGYNADLIPEALRELARYGGDNDQAKITGYLVKAMLTGSPVVAKAISENVSPFVNSETLPAFRDALASLPDSSDAKEGLRHALAR